jgi:alpha-glucosidase
MKSKLLILLTLSIIFQSFGQIQNVEKINTYQKTIHGLAGKTNQGAFAISVYNAHTIRIQIAKNQTVDNFSYALQNNAIPDFKDFSIVEKGKQIIISTASLQVEIEKEPFLRLTFKDIQGNILSEDMPGKGMATVFDGHKVTTYRKLQTGERFVGMGESLGNLDRANSIVTTWNTDNYKYDDPRVPMYISIPFFMGVTQNKVYGIYYDNSFKGTFNFGTSNTRFSSVSFEGGEMDYFFMHDVSMAKILTHYTALTGRMPLPPKWSIGYHQSRCSYYPEEQVNFIAETFRNKKIPLDCIVLDADYLQDYEPFRINLRRFPEMKAMAKRLQEKGIELTASVNPGIKIDSSYEAYHDGLKSNIFLRYQDGELYKTEIYPNMNHYVDFTSPKGRNWWIDQMKIYQDLGINGYWNDMNEPAINGQAMPDNIVFDFEGRKSYQPEAHNLYGFLMARSSFESFKKYGGNKRPFVMTRSAFAGVQRYATVWSGDNQAKDEHILLGSLLNNTLGLSGIPFVGPDLGGYIGDGNKDLYKRWVEMGVFSPFLRNHREQFAAANEPWAYGEEAEAISKTYISFRYKLLPYLYAKFYETSQTGIPIARSLCLDNPFEANVYNFNYQHQFLFGDALLIAPLTSKEKTKAVYFPAGKWYNIYTDEIITGGKEITKEYPIYNLPLYVKESSIVPMQSLTQSTKQMPSDTLFVHIYAGEKENIFTYYEDDGSTMNYQKGNFYRRNITFDPIKKQIRFDKSVGDFVSHFQKMKIILHGFNNNLNLSINQKAISSNVETIKLIDPIGDLEDVYFDKNYYNSLKLADRMKPQITFTSDFGNQALIIKW